MEGRMAGERETPTATPRAQPFNCPYCGLEELLPEEEDGTWYCESCTRVFELRLLRVAR
jgi:ribosomal protein L37AE/L43A